MLHQTPTGWALQPPEILNPKIDFSTRSDIIVPLDELPPYHITTERLTASVFLSHRWEARSLREHLKDLRQQVGCLWSICCLVF